MQKKTSHRCSKKQPYRLRNWSEYTQALRQRASITLWIEEAALSGWINPTLSGKRGASDFYSEGAILCCLSLKQIYHLPLRQLQGFIGSVFALMQVELPVPDYTTLSRRGERLLVSLPKKDKDEPVHLVIDSSGFKVYGEGEWKVRQHGKSKRRTWRKLHLALDADTQEVLACVVTTNDFSDGQILTDLLEEVPEPIETVKADGAYDHRSGYTQLAKRGIKAIIPPRKGARIWVHGNSKAARLDRDQNLRAIRRKGRKRWKQESGYHQRSLSETGVYRLKTIFSDRLSARVFDGQATELFIRCAALNKMTHLGMPDSYAA
jgi:IS5 family transposase